MNNSLDDIVFENRNKEYGAFSLRKKYNKTLIVSLITSISITSLISIILLLQFIFQQDNSNPSIKDIYYYETANINNIMEFEKIEIAIPAKEKKEINEERVKNYIVTDSLTETLLIKDEFENQPLENVNNINDSVSEISNNESESVKNQIIYYYIDRDTGFLGGISALRNFISENIIYPQDAINGKINGTVIVQFSVTETGKVDSLKINQSVYYSLDNEVVRVVKILPEKILGLQNRKNIKIWYILPIKFSYL